MKRFIIRLGITAAFFIVISSATDWYITDTLRHSKARLFQSWNDIIYGNLDCDVVIMGSSRGFVQYSPAIIDSMLGVNSYNLAGDGRCIDAEVVKYNTYRCFNPKPKLIIQNVDYGTMALSNGYEREQFLPYISCDTLYQQLRESEGFDWSDRYLPLVRYAGYLQVIKEGLGLPNKLNQYPLYKGYFGRDAYWDGSVFDTIDKIDYCYNPEALKICEQYLARCQQENIRVVLVFAPIYIGVTEKTNHPEELFAKYEELAQQYDCKLLNYTYDSISYDTTYFYNASHMNKKGAELFSTHLSRDLKEIMDSE